MVDPVSLASAAVGLLIPLLMKLGDKTLERVSDDLVDAADSHIQGLYERIRAKLSGNKYAAGLLEGVETQPDNQARQANLQTALAEELGRDQGFASAINQLVTQAQRAGAVTIHASNTGVVAGRDVHMRAEGGGTVVGRDQITHPTAPPTQR